jgi:hypothetical protein
MPGVGAPTSYAPVSRSKRRTASHVPPILGPDSAYCRESDGTIVNLSGNPVDPSTVNEDEVQPGYDSTELLLRELIAIHFTAIGVIFRAISIKPVACDRSLAIPLTLATVAFSYSVLGLVLSSLDAHKSRLTAIDCKRSSAGPPDTRDQHASFHKHYKLYLARKLAFKLTWIGINGSFVVLVVTSLCVAPKRHG